MSKRITISLNAKLLEGLKVIELGPRIAWLSTSHVSAEGINVDHTDGGAAFHKYRNLYEGKNDLSRCLLFALQNVVQSILVICLR